MSKLKMTGKQSWTPKARGYSKWKQHVVGAFIGAISSGPLARSKSTQVIGHRLAMGHKPICLGPGESAFMSIAIRFCGGVHGDPENVFGSIADALFDNDKRLSGAFFDVTDFMRPDEWADVAVKIEVFEAKTERIDSIGAGLASKTYTY